MREHIAGQIHARLLKKKLTIAAAESCTGGLISKLLTDYPGSSAYFTLGVVTYSNGAKKNILDIPLSLIDKEGAVSRAVAVKMADSARKLGKADIGLGITGIAGPGGGSPTKPVGTVFIGLSTIRKTICKKFHFSGNRPSIRKKAALKALGLALTACP
jgi:PncC family amidohydrolase